MFIESDLDAEFFKKSVIRTLHIEHDVIQEDLGTTAEEILLHFLDSFSGQRHLCYV